MDDLRNFNKKTTNLFHLQYLNQLIKNSTI